MDLRTRNSRNDVFNAENVVYSSKYIVAGGVECKFPMHWVEEPPYVGEVEGGHCRGKIDLVGFARCFV